MLRRPSGDRVLLRMYRDSGANDAHAVTVSKRLRLPAGDYRWAIYDAERLYAPNDPQYWTADHQVAQGQVTVP